MAPDHVKQYADEVSTFLVQEYDFAQPDPYGAKFDGGVLIDIGEGERVAFFYPGRALPYAMLGLLAYLDEHYPGSQCGPILQVGKVVYSQVQVQEVPLDGVA